MGWSLWRNYSGWRSPEVQRQARTSAPDLVTQKEGFVSGLGYLQRNLRNLLCHVHFEYRGCEWSEGEWKSDWATDPRWDNQLYWREKDKQCKMPQESGKESQAEGEKGNKDYLFSLLHSYRKWLRWALGNLSIYISLSSIPQS